jgi:hypothetical protein
MRDKKIIGKSPPESVKLKGKVAFTRVDNFKQTIFSNM